MATVTRSEHPPHPSTYLWDTQVSHPARMSLTTYLGNTGDPCKPWPGPWHTAEPSQAGKGAEGTSQGVSAKSSSCLGTVGREGTQPGRGHTRPGNT